MKVGIDGVLLGAWAHHASISPKTVLDIGTGTGLLALMLAQRFPLAKIDAVEIDKEAADQASDNVQASPFAGQIQVFPNAIQAFQKSKEGDYDLIVSNPPYFSNSLLAPDEGRRLARHALALSHKELLNCAGLLLAPQGQFCLILPWDIGRTFLKEAMRRGWSVYTSCSVQPRPGRLPNRVLLQLGRTPAWDKPKEDQLCIYAAEKGKEWSEAFKHLTQDFYLSADDQGEQKWPSER